MARPKIQKHHIVYLPDYGKFFRVEDIWQDPHGVRLETVDKKVSLVKLIKELNYKFPSEVDDKALNTMPQAFRIIPQVGGRYTMTDAWGTSWLDLECNDVKGGIFRLKDASNKHSSGSEFFIKDLDYLLTEIFDDTDSFLYPDDLEEVYTAEKLKAINGSGKRDDCIKCGTKLRKEFYCGPDPICWCPKCEP